MVIDQVDTPDAPADLVIRPPGRPIARAPNDTNAQQTDDANVQQNEVRQNPLDGNGPERIRTHGDDQYFSSDHCETRDCTFKRGHAGPCSNMLPNDGRDLHDGRPSASLRPRNRANFTHQENTNLSTYLIHALCFAAVAVSDTLGQEGALPDISSFSSVGAFYCSAFDNQVFAAMPNTETAASIPIPKGVRQALASDRRDFWLESIYKEYYSILSHNVFRTVRRVDLPPGSDVMRCHCVFTVKSNADGSIERYKCRLVADGNTQTYGVNFQDIFSTVVKFSTFRMALHLAAVRDYNITTIDISTAFLYGAIDNDNCYMEMPEGLPRYDADGYELVCHLLKSLYGLKQAPRIWFNHFKTSLLSFGFVQSDVDPCLFIYQTASGAVIYGLLWVDDLVLMTNDDSERDRLVRFLREDREYTLPDMTTQRYVHVSPKGSGDLSPRDGCV